MGKTKPYIEGIKDHELDQIFFALSDSSRRSIISTLASQDLNISRLSDLCSISIASTSKHVKVLVSAGLISQRIDGKLRICGLKFQGLSKAQTWLTSLGLLDPLDLSNLEEFLDSQKLK